MRTMKLGNSQLDVPVVAVGCMRIDALDMSGAERFVHAALEQGANFFDHADIYGKGQCEEIFADAVHMSSSVREGLILQSKCGIRPGTFDFSKEHILASVNGILGRLKTDYIDILLLHRPDALVEPDEVARAFDELEAAGKVRAFGVSNQTPRQIDLLKTSVKQPIVANQLQLSVTHAPIVAQGVATNMHGLDQSATLDGGGILDYCRINHITVQAWSPFQAGFFTGVFLDNPEYAELNAVIDRLAAQYDVPSIAIATAWITRHPAQMQVVLGTTTPQRVTDAALGSDIPLTRPEWYEIFRAAGYQVP